MKASPLEYRLRYLLLGILYLLGFLAPWERYTSFNLGSSTLWLFLASLPAREHWLTFTASSQILLVLGCVLATAAAILKVWAASFRYSGVVARNTPGDQSAVADGPFRHSRNPLYLGTFLNALALCLLMPPTGAIVAIALLALLQVRLVGAEEGFLLNKLGDPYRRYCAAVPRFLPSLRPRVPAAGTRPDYRNGLLSELFFIGCAISFLTLGSNFNSTLLLKGILISLGLSIAAKAFIPKRLEATSSNAITPGIQP